MAAISQTTFVSAFSWIHIYTNITLNCVRFGPIDNISALVQMKAWRRIWTNVGKLYWRKDASLGLNELNMTAYSIDSISQSQQGIGIWFDAFY